MTGAQGSLLMTEGPAIDTTVTLMPTSSPTVHTAKVRSWTSGAAGLVVTSHVQAAPESVAALDGQRVWVSTEAFADETGATVVPHAVFQAVAQAHGDDVLALTGVMLLAAETRRGAVRASTSRAVHLMSEEGTADARTVDLSRTGMRMEGDRLPRPHQEIDVALDLEDGVEVHARAEVVRVDEANGEAVVRFVGIERSAADALERSVLIELARQNRGDS